MSDPTRFFGDMSPAKIRTLLGGVSSHDVGPEPRSRHPPGCIGNPDPLARDHHRDCVVADRWARACAARNCQYWDRQAEKPDHEKECPGHLGVRRFIAGECRVTWRHCARREAWGEVQEQTGKHARPIGGTRRLAIDEPAPWEAPVAIAHRKREPGEEG